MSSLPILFPFRFALFYELHGYFLGFGCDYQIVSDSTGKNTKEAL